MKIDSFKETNYVYGAGNNPNTDQLPVAICTNEHMPNLHFIISKWVPTDEEIQMIVERKEIWLSVMGPSIAPMSIMTQHPFKEGGFTPIEI